MFCPLGRAARESFEAGQTWGNKLDQIYVARSLGDDFDFRRILHCKQSCKLNKVRSNLELEGNMNVFVQSFQASEMKVR